MPPAVLFDAPQGDKLGSTWSLFEHVKSDVEPPSVNVLSLPEVSMSEVSLENGAVEKSDSRLWLDQTCLTPLRGLDG